MGRGLTSHMAILMLMLMLVLGLRLVLGLVALLLSKVINPVVSPLPTSSLIIMPRPPVGGWEDVHCKVVTMSVQGQGPRTMGPTTNNVTAIVFSPPELLLMRLLIWLSLLLLLLAVGCNVGAVTSSF